MEPRHVFIILTCLALVMVVAAVAVFIIRRRQKEKNQGLDHLAARLPASRDKDALSGVFQGVPYTFWLSQKPRQSLYGRVRVPCDAPGFILARKMDLWDRLGVRLGMVRPVAYNDPEWDGAVMLAPDDPQGARSWLQNPQRRRATAELCRMQGMLLLIFGGSATCHFPAYLLKEGKEPMSAGVLARVISRAAALAGESAGRDLPPKPKFAGIPPHRKALDTYTTGLSATAFLAVFFLMAATHLFAPLYTFKSVAQAAQWCVLPFLLSLAVLLCLSFKALKGRLDGHRAFAAAAFLGAAALVLLWAGAFFMANGALDTGPEQVRHARVVGMRKVAGKPTVHKVRVEFSEDRQAPVEIKVPRSVYDSLHPGDAVSLGTRPGRLHVEWITRPLQKA